MLAISLIGENATPACEQPISGRLQRNRCNRAQRVGPRDLVVLAIKQDKLMAENDLRTLFLPTKTRL